MNDKLKHQKNYGMSYVKIVMLLIVTFGAQILSLIKSTVVAASFGASEEMDAYNFVNSILTFVFGIVAASVSTIIIPEYSNKRKRSAVDTFITVIYGGCLVIVTLLGIFRGAVIDLLSNKSASFSATAASVMTTLLISQYLTAFTGILTAYCQCEDKPVVPKIINLVCQACVLAVLVWLCRGMSIWEYAVIISCGSLGSFALELVFSIKKGWRFKPTLEFNNESTLMFKRFLPIVFSGGVYQLSLLIDSMIAAGLSTGTITILSYSTQISSMASAIVVGNLLLYMYPKITRDASTTGYQTRFWEQTRGIHAIVCLMIAGFACVGKETVIALLNRGKFSLSACNSVYYAALIYIFGQGISILRDMLYRYFYALGNTKIPAQNSILVSVCNISLSLILVKLIGLYGLIIGTVLASAVSLFMIMLRFHRNIGFSRGILDIMCNFGKNFFVTLLTILVVYITKYSIHITNNLLSILVFGVETVVVYIMIQWIANKGIVDAVKNCN